MDQGKTTVNGPHQGAWVDTPTGENWFLHFQDKDAYGRVVHLQPMRWVNDWPVIGIDTDGDGKGEPVMTYTKPNVGKTYPIATPAESDEFNGAALGKQWQWQANPEASWAFPDAGRGVLMLFTAKSPDSARNLWDVPNLLLQKFPTENFTATAKLKFTPNVKLENERTGLIIMGLSYVNIAVKSGKDGLSLVYVTCKAANKGGKESERTLTKLNGPDVYLRVNVSAGAVCKFSYSTDGIQFTAVPDTFKAEPGQWIGAKVGIFATRATQINDSGYAAYDWFRVTP
jgi:beta-xylosidase